MTHKLIAEIASDNSKLHKIAVINREAIAGNSVFFAGLRYALDNIDTFGVKKIPVRSGVDGPGLSFANFSVLADDLIKRKTTGHAALDCIDNCMSTATNDEWNGWYRLILTKDFRANFTEATVNKAVKDVNKDYVIPTTPYMRCSLPDKSNMEDWDWSVGIFSQLKSDGMFANVNVENDGSVRVTSRGGTEFPENCLGFEAALGATFDKGTQTHGELLVYENGNLMERQVGNGILNSVAQGGSLEPGQIVVYESWDQIPLSAVVPKGKYNVQYSVRFSNLERQIKAGNHVGRIRLTETRIVKSMVEALAHYKEFRARKLEGSVCKHPTAIWKDGTSKDQVKMKEEVYVELRVKGFNPGKGKNAATFGSIISESECGLLECGVSGFDDKTRLEIHLDRENWPGKIITVCSNSLQKPSKSKKNGLWSLFLPRFTEERKDKDTADTLVEIQAQFSAAEAIKKSTEEDEDE